METQDQTNLQIFNILHICLNDQKAHDNVVSSDHITHFSI